MPRKTIRYKILRMIDMISKASDRVIPLGELKFSHHRTDKHLHVYKILTPVTRVWQELEISDTHIAAKTLPKEICELIEYYTKLRPLMDRARDLKVFDEDVRPISAEEQHMFGVRVGKNNPCLPNPYESFSGITRSVREMSEYMKKASVAMGKNYYGT